MTNNCACEHSKDAHPRNAEGLTFCRAILTRYSDGTILPKLIFPTTHCDGCSCVKEKIPQECYACKCQEYKEVSS